MEALAVVLLMVGGFWGVVGMWWALGVSPTLRRRRQMPPVETAQPEG